VAEFRLDVRKDYTVFCAGHFVTYDGDQCEPLHGHNYRVSLRLEGGLDQTGYTYNFTALKRSLRELCDLLDHRMLLPTDNPLLQITREPQAYVVRFAAKKWVFPAEDVVQLPIRNTTAELLAQWLAEQIRPRLEVQASHNLTALELEVEETAGQSATCRLKLA
jgi:6-pyruvoyltetrahydropterin/6-carboxytetrahydropterin synthase